MSASDRRPRFMRRLVNFVRPVLRRLRFFPFTLLLVLLNAAHRTRELRRGMAPARVAEVGGAAPDLPRDAMLWLHDAAPPLRSEPFDVCLKLPRESEDANLQDVFSSLLALTQFRSLGLYWDASSYADDRRLWGVREEHPRALASYVPPTRKSASSGRSDAPITLPVAAARDAQTLLKREAESALAVCLNLAPAHRLLAKAAVNARPEMFFLDLSPAPASTQAPNYRSLFGQGLILHERMAVVCAADAYVGSFDELGCAAQMWHRPAVLLHGAAGERRGEAAGDATLWLPESTEPAMLMQELLQFLSRWDDAQARAREAG
jgi:hypothetical protein